MTTDGLRDVLDEKFRQCSLMDAPLADRLLAFANEVRRLGPHFATAVDDLVDRLMENGAGTTAPKPGDAMPSFLLPNEQGQLVGLEDLLKQGPVALSFNRGHWCPYCRMNVAALARAEQDSRKQRGHIVAIVPDRQKYAAWLKADADAPFPILTDMDNGYAASLDLAIWVGETMKSMMESAGWDPAVSQGTNDWTLPIPATFIVGTDGIIAARFVDPDYRNRMAIDDMIAALVAAR
ncbi:MAG: peroxiredoxin-like family protein [Dongiaceae bacterium]